MHPIIIVGSLVIAFFGGITGLVYLSDSHSCHATADAMGVKAEYGFWTSCIIEVNGTKMPLSNYRGLETLSHD